MAKVGIFCPLTYIVIRAEVNGPCLAPFLGRPSSSPAFGRQFGAEAGAKRCRVTLAQIRAILTLPTMVATFSAIFGPGGQGQRSRSTWTHFPTGNNFSNHYQGGQYGQNCPEVPLKLGGRTYRGQNGQFRLLWRQEHAFQVKVEGQGQIQPTYHQLQTLSLISIGQIRVGIVSKRLVLWLLLFLHTFLVVAKITLVNHIGRMGGGDFKTCIKNVLLCTIQTGIECRLTSSVNFGPTMYGVQQGSTHFLKLFWRL